MDESITLANGRILTGHIVEASGRAFLYLFGITLADAFPLLIDPENTVEMTWEQYGNTGTVTGYNHLTAISEEGGGMISAVLKVDDNV